MEIYNTLSRKKERFPSVDEQHKVRLFVCGLTVYDDAHVGHARTYLFFDFFASYLRSLGYAVNYLQNITDIDDKIIARAAERNMSPGDLAKHFSDSYRSDMRALGIDAVTTYAPATEFISQIVAQVERLIDKGFAYQIDGDGWYFDIAKDEDYGKLSGRTVAQAEDGVSRIDDSDAKRNRGDFCLWKFSKPNEPVWNTSLGPGRPGWHIEDTAISEYYFGPQYDIHGGADDLKFPHHEAELAQQESASGLKPFVRWWMHTGFLLVNGKKMAKSAGNFVTIKDFLKENPPEILRWIMLAHHYRSPVDFSDELVAQGRAALGNLSERFAALSDDGALDDAAAAAWRERFHAALGDDLNTPQALAVMFDLLKEDALSPADRRRLVLEFDGILKLGIAERAAALVDIPQEIAEKLRRYEQFRADKQFVQSDALRNEIESLGYEVRDTAEGSRITKKTF